MTYERARIHGVLAVPARVALLDRLRASPQPVDAQALATSIGLHVTTVRFHLDVLIEAGLVTAARRQPPGRGRPRTIYAASLQDGGAPEESYRELADLLATHFGDTPARRRRRAERAGADWAAQRLGPTPEPTPSATEARRRVTGLFAEMGFDPEPAAGCRILLHDCPFRDTARAHPEVVCAAHQGLLTGLLARLDPTGPAPILEPFAEPGLCVITFDDATPTGTEQQSEVS